MTGVQWSELVNIAFTIVITLVAALYIRIRAEQIGRDELARSLTELREQISDRDRSLIGLREELKGLTSRCDQASQDLDRKQRQILALLNENLELKRTLAARPAHRPRKEKPDC